MELNTKPLEISIHNSRIILSGDLNDSPLVLTRLREFLKPIPKFSQLVIEAQEAFITPEGVTAWIQAVEQFLMGCEIIYVSSQLGTILQYDERYKHPTSSFQEYNHSSLQEVNHLRYESHEEEVAAYSSSVV